MATVTVGKTEVRGKTEAELQDDVAELQALAEARLRIWRSAGLYPRRKNRIAALLLKYLRHRRQSAH
jgi:hypothetical protein